MSHSDPGIDPGILGFVAGLQADEQNPKSKIQKSGRQAKVPVGESLGILDFGIWNLLFDFFLPKDFGFWILQSV